MATPVDINAYDIPLPVDEVSRLNHLIDRARSSSAPGAEYATTPQTAVLPGDQRHRIQLPGLSSIFPAFSRSNSELAYPTPTGSDTVLSPADASSAYVTPNRPPEQKAFTTHLEAIRRGFAFHRKCNRYAFIAYDDTQMEQVFREFQVDVAENRFVTEARLCEIYAIAVIASTFNRVQIPARVGDVFYHAASDRIGDWIYKQPLTAMRCCALLGLTNLFQKATISLLYFDLALALASRLWLTMGVRFIDMSRPDHVEFCQVWRSVVFARAWLQYTIGVCTSDAHLWLPPITTKATDGNDMDTSAQFLLLIPVEIARISVIAAKAMRMLTACKSPTALLPAIKDLNGELGAWYAGLPPHARASELTQTPWVESQVALAYVHLGHLGAVTLILRKTLSVYRPLVSSQKLSLQPAERSQLAAIFNDSIVASKQSSRILYLFLGEQAGVRHCWAVIYVAFVSAAILLYCSSQMQLHDYPDDKWQPYLSLVADDMKVLAYCQELDPVASTLRDTLSQYMQFLQIPSRAPKRMPAPPWTRATLKDPYQVPPEATHGKQDLVDLMLTVPKGRAGPAQTSLDLLKLVCQPFNDAHETNDAAPNGYNGSGMVPHVFGSVLREPSIGQRGRLAADAGMPFGWQQCQSSTAFTGRSTNLALTMAQQEMLKAGV